MTFAETALLGALAGATIFLSLPFGRLTSLGPRARVALAMFAVGVLAFLFVDVFEHAFEIVEGAVKDAKAGDAGIGHGIGLTALLALGFTAGSAGLALVERRMRPRALPPVAGGSGEAASLEAVDALELERYAARARALRVGM